MVNTTARIVLCVCVLCSFVSRFLLRALFLPFLPDLPDLPDLVLFIRVLSPDYITIYSRSERMLVKCGNCVNVKQ